jgi:hypothetical protein
VTTLRAAMALLAGFSAAVSADLAEEPLGTTNERALWEFQVLLDGRDIGYHRFDIQDQDGVERVDIEARFEVEFMFITAYRYEHDNLETWQGDCLREIESSTDDNGKQYDIAGQAGDSSFALDRNDATENLDTPCLQTFAYWNPGILRAERLLNAQTGEWKPVTVESVGTGPFEVSGVPIAAEEYRLLIPDGAIRLWYQESNGQWLGLETETKGGRTLRYEPRLLPQPPRTPSDPDIARRDNSKPGITSP